jgi:hypothetical protein
VTAILNKTAEQIREEKSVLRMIAIQALLPSICSVPTGIFLLMLLLRGWDSANLTIFRYGENQEYQYTFAVLCNDIVMLGATVDSFITLLVVKSYRNAANVFLAKFKVYRIFIEFKKRVLDNRHVPLFVRSTVAPS